MQVGQVTPVGESAFAEAWGEIAVQVSARCRRLSRDAHEAQELYQLTAIRAWRGHASFRGESGYLTWVMRILDREAARLASQRNRIASREITIDPQAADDRFSDNLRGFDRDTEGGDRGGCGETGWLAALLADAAANQAISATEHRVVSERLAHTDAAWPAIGARLGMTATACAVAHSRAVPKLRVFLFTDRGALIGGDRAIADAFERVRRDQGAALTALEEEAFEHIVIRRSAGYRRRGSQAALRGACAKGFAACEDGKRICLAPPPMPEVKKPWPRLPNPMAAWKRKRLVGAGAKLVTHIKIKDANPALLEDSVLAAEANFAVQPRPT